MKDILSSILLLVFLSQYSVQEKKAFHENIMSSQKSKTTVGLDMVTKLHAKGRGATCVGPLCDKGTYVLPSERIRS